MVARIATSAAMPHGSQAECDKWHEMEQELRDRLRAPVADMEEAKCVVQRTKSASESIELMCSLARAELRASPGLSSCSALVEHGMRDIMELQRAMDFALRSIESCRYLVSEAVVAYHDSIVPHISSEELDTINRFDHLKAR